MNIVNILYLMTIYPLELLFEVIFSLSEKTFHNPVFSIVVLSLMVNFLAFPLYKRADVIQAQERDQSKKMEKMVKHIRDHFKGDERFMLLQYYYQSENYRPVYALRSSIPLLLQIPFFTAAYRFLSGLTYLEGVRLGPIESLAAPDHILWGINLLPILMTLINLTSSVIYCRDMPLRSKLQTYGIAIIFLVLLYNSPSGLVFYWTLNNVFSLAKNIVMKLIKLPKKKVDTSSIATIPTKAENKIFALASVGLALLIGGVISGSALAASPLNYVDIGNYEKPSVMVYSSLFVAIGFFVAWFGVYYLLGDSKFKKVFSYICSVLLLSSVANYFFIKRPFYRLSTTFEIYSGSAKYYYADLLSMLYLILIILVVFFLWKYKKEILTAVLTIAAIGLAIFSIKYIVTINSMLGNEYYLSEGYFVQPEFNLSTEGQNVVVLMVDRGIGGYIGYAAESLDGFEEGLDGFTYYPNTLATGNATLFSAPSIFGGPEYTSIGMNLRPDEDLSDKLNESQLVLPLLFQDDGYNATVVNPVYTGYSAIPHISIFADQGVDAYYVAGAFNELRYSDEERGDNIIKLRNRNIFMYSFVMAAYPGLYDTLYDNGYYNALGDYRNGRTDTLLYTMLDGYYELNSLSNMTNVTNDSSNNYIQMANSLPHSTYILLESMCNPDWFNMHYNGNEVSFERIQDKISIQVNMLAYEALFDWFEYLKANNVYDNTRIIIVSDHGDRLGLFDSMIINNDELYLDVMAYNSVLLVKDFNAHGFTVDESVATIADVPYMATSGLIDNPVNPITNNPIAAFNTENGITIFSSENVNPMAHTGNRFIDGDWYVLEGDDVNHMSATRIDAP